MKRTNSQYTLYRAFTTGREYFQLLDDLGPIIDAIATDPQWQKRFIKYLFGKKKKSNRGPKGHDIVFIIRLILVQCITRKDYRELAALIRDSEALKHFLEIKGVPDANLPEFQTISGWIKKLPPEFFEEINWHLVKKEGKENLEMDLEDWRADATVVESNIHYPTDSALLNDALRWMFRWIEQMREDLGIKSRMNIEELTFKKAKKIYLLILKIKGFKPKQKKQRKKMYRELIELTEQIMMHFERHVEKGRKGEIFCAIESPLDYAKFVGMLEEWDRLKPLIEQAIDQAKKRVLKGKKIENDDKLLSLWEEHTRVIIRGKSGVPCEFGHKITLWESAEGLILCGDVYKEGNPSESKVIEDEIKELKRHDMPIIDVSVDRGYWNEKKLKEIMIDENITIYCPKKGKRDVERTEYEHSEKFKEKQRFRAGIEGSISVLVRRHALRRSRLKKWDGFNRHVQMCIIGMNLLRLLDWKKRQEFIKNQKELALLQ